jgi:transcriptional regulator of acetoin/glycerol metabolism
MYNRITFTEEQYLEIKESYGGDLNQLRVTLSINELKNVVKFINSLKTENNEIEIDEDLVFKTSLEEAATTDKFKKLEKQKDSLIPLYKLRYDLEILALKRTFGDVELASKELGISKRTLYRDIKEFSINLECFKI